MKKNACFRISYLKNVCSARFLLLVLGILSTHHPHSPPTPWQCRHRGSTFQFLKKATSAPFVNISYRPTLTGNSDQACLLGHTRSLNQNNKTAVTFLYFSWSLAPPETWNQTPTIFHVPGSFSNTPFPRVSSTFTPHPTAPSLPHPHHTSCLSLSPTHTRFSQYSSFQYPHHPPCFKILYP